MPETVKTPRHKATTFVTYPINSGKRSRIHEACAKEDHLHGF